MSSIQKISSKEIISGVLAKVEAFQASGELRLPADYSAENALKAAQLILLDVRNRDGKTALEHCTPHSIANSLLKMVVWGLSPLKKQCDFIMRGTELCCETEYTGSILLAKRYGKLDKHKGNAIFKGDDFKYEITEEGRRRLIHHKQSLDSVGGEVIGAYVTYTLTDGTSDMEIMNIAQIHNAWLQGSAKGNSIAHKNFSDQMAIKTVYNRMCKLLIRTSDDSVLLGENDTPTPDSSEPQPEKRFEVAETIDFEEETTQTTEEATRPTAEEDANSAGSLFKEQDEQDPY